MLILKSFIETNLSKEFKDQLFSIKFSQHKVLFQYQVRALQSAQKVLSLFYGDCKGNKALFHEMIYQHLVPEHYQLAVTGKLKDYIPLLDGKVSFSTLVNRAGFWMATGSGKTLVIVKLIELIKNMMTRGIIPEKDILFLTARDDLIQQFIDHVDEYNSFFQNPYRIRLVSLLDFEKTKFFGKPLFHEDVQVFFYRSDLLNDLSGEKRIDFETIFNGGNWYLILDEAHKGDKAESKTQAILTALTSNGFMFNFSATFTEEIDFWTCAYEYNISSFIRDGYGKYVYISSLPLQGFDKKRELDFPESLKEKTVLKMLILHSWLSKLKKSLGKYYPRPLTVVLANSVNTEDADLELFFLELVKVAKGEVDKADFETVKNELYEELLSAKCFFTDQVLDSVIVGDLLKVTLDDIFEEFFHAAAPANIEVRFLPNNKQEIAFALKTSTKPFALLKIGDIGDWLTKKLAGYEIVGKYENESYFRNLNFSDINLLMGSRAFYEGWDSPRPNIIFYINLGKESAKKFVLQSMGRGLRVAPVFNKRMRIEFLEEKRDLDMKKAKFLEFLYIFGSKPSTLEKILETVQREKDEAEELCELGNLLQINPEIKDKPLLVPDYRIEKPTDKEEWYENFVISLEDYELMNAYLHCIPDKILMVQHELSPTVLRKIKDAFTRREIIVRKDYPSYKNPSEILRILNNRTRVNIALNGLRKLSENDIKHFRKIRVPKRYIEPLKKEIQRVLHGKESVVETYEIKRLQRHYYTPVILGSVRAYAQHIVKNPSEINFVKEIEEFQDRIFVDFDWWYFSKIDESVDNVYIPYFDTNLKRFFPDFIFWLKKGNEYTILFVDPKSAAFTQAFNKIEGYRLIFESKGRPKIFEFENMKVRILLTFFSTSKDQVPNAYREYWVVNVSELETFVRKKMNNEDVSSY